MKELGEGRHVPGPGLQPGGAQPPCDPGGFMRDVIGVDEAPPQVLRGRGEGPVVDVVDHGPQQEQRGDGQ